MRVRARARLERAAADGATRLPPYHLLYRQFVRPPAAVCFCSAQSKCRCFRARDATMHFEQTFDRSDAACEPALIAIQRCTAICALASSCRSRFLLSALYSLFSAFSISTGWVSLPSMRLL